MNLLHAKSLATALVALAALLIAPPGAQGQATVFGSGCSGLEPEASLSFSGSLTPGESGMLSLTGAPANATVVLIAGVSDTLSSAGFPLPMDLTGIDGVNPGCSLLISTELFFIFETDALGDLGFGFKIPFGLGEDLYFQYAIFEQSSPLSITMTQAVHLPLTNTVTPSASDIAFDSAYVTEMSTAELTLTNHTDRPQTIEDVLVFDADATDFAISFPAAFPFTLPPGGDVIGSLTFTPSMAGLRTAKIEIDHFDLPLGFFNPVIDVSGIGLEAFGKELHVDAGGPGIFDSQFQIWSPDFGSVDGFTASTRNTIANTADEELYQTWRHGPAVSYEYPLPNADYEVELHFVEPTATAIGERLFDVFVENTLVLEDVDLFAESGSETASQLIASAPVADGALSIDIVGSVGDGIITGIEVRRLFTGLMVSDTEIDFGFLAGGETLTLPLTLTNTGTDTLDFTSISFDIGVIGGSGDQFKLTLDGVDYTGTASDTSVPTTFMLAPGASIIADLTFQPDAHFANEIMLSFDGNFDAQTVRVLGSGGSEGHPFLHVVIEAPKVWVDYDNDGMVEVTLDGSFSHTHEPGKVIDDHEWTDIGDNVVGSFQRFRDDFALGQHTICLTITDDNVPGESLQDCYTFRVVSPDMVPGVLARYYIENGGNPSTLLDSIPTNADFAEVLPELRVGSGTQIGGTSFTEDVMARLVAVIDITTAGDYEFLATGGLDHRLELDGVPVAGPATLAVGTYTLEARFAVDTLADLPLEVTMSVNGGSAEPILTDTLYHDQTAVMPVINSMPTEGITLGGNAIDIQGFGFFPVDDVVVHWGVSDLTGGSINVPSANSITFSSPPQGAGVISVSVETPQGVSNSRLFEYDPAANPPIIWSSKEIATVTEPTQGVFGPDGTFYATGRYGEIFEITLDDDYNAVSTITHPGVSGLAPINETLGIAINPYETDPLRIYVAHSDLYAQGGNIFEGPAPFVGQISYLEAPNFDTPVPVVTNLPTSNHDHGLNGMFFDNNGDLYLALGSNTNAGIKHPKSGDLPESPLTAAILKFETSKTGVFNGDITYELSADGSLVDDQVLGEVIDIPDNVDVEVWASGVRNAYDMVYTTKRRIYATDNGPNVTFGASSTGPDTEGPPVGKPDELLRLEPTHYYGHPNRARGRTDPRQNIYRSPAVPTIAGEYTGQLAALSSSTNGITEYRADTFGGQMRGDLLAQRWNSTIRRIKLAEDGRTVDLTVNMENLGSLDIVHGPGGALIGVDHGGDAIRVLQPVDVSATGMTAFDIFPWRALPAGGQTFIIGGTNFGTLGDTTVQIGTLSATVTSVSSTRIVGTLPAQPNPTVDLLDVVIFSGGSASIIADAFRFLEPTPGNEPGLWEVRDPMPVALGEVAGGIVGPRLFLVGEGNSDTHMLNTITNQWSTRAERLFVGHHHSAEVIGDKVYLFSGLGGGSEGRVQIYHHGTDSWAEGAAMPWTGGSLSTALIDGKVYAAGGIVGSNTVANAGVYDPVADSWTAIAAMPVGRNHAAGGTDGSKFYVFGGRSGGNWVSNGFDDVQVYDPDTDTWEWDKDGLSTLAPLPIGRGGMGRAIWYDGEFYVFGGETTDGPGATVNDVYDRVDVYNPETNTWRLDAPMPTPRHGIFPVNDQSRILLIGGGDTAGNDQETTVEVFQRY